MRTKAKLEDSGLKTKLIGIGLAVFVAGSLTRPPRVLSHTAEKVAAGDLSAHGTVAHPTKWLREAKHDYA